MTAWVLLRGLVREARHWGDFPEVLNARTGAEVLTPDLPGNGSRWAERSPVSVAGMVAACRAGLAASGHSPPYSLLGLSLGGMVAAEWSLRHPGEVARVAMINTSMRPLQPVYRRLLPGTWPTLVTGLVKRDVRAREAGILTLVSNDEMKRRRALAVWVDAATTAPVAKLNALRQLLAAARYRLPPGQPLMPALVLASAQDRLVSPQCSRVLAARWQALYLEHAQAGHDLPLDAGDWLAEKLAGWILEGGPPGRAQG